MADDTDAPEMDADDQADATEATDTESGGDPGEDARIKAALKKANEEAKNLRLKLKEYEDRDKSETEKLTERLSAAEKRALEAERLEIALERGLTRSQAKRLVGSTREELEADADELLADLGAASQDREPPPSKPREQLRGGGDPTEDVEPDIRSVVDSIPRGF